MADKSGGSNEIRIIKRGRAGGSAHGGAWKVAYADFVTAMMAFFLVMWITGLSNEVRQAIAAYFKDPVGFMAAVHSGRAPFLTPGVTNTSGDKGIQSRPSITEADDLARAKQSIERIVRTSPEFKKLENAVDVHLVDEGLQIDLIDGQQNLFFDSGSARVKPATRRLLIQISAQLSKLTNKLVIEGHTDKRPLSSRPGYTNWELSADRANAARTIMQGGGLKPDQIDQVRGYAATHPRNPDPYHYSNRRVSIIVMFNRLGTNDKLVIGKNNVSTAINDRMGQPTGEDPVGPPIDPKIRPK